MEFVIFAAAGLALVAVILGILILQRVSRPMTVPEELSTRISVLEQIASSLPGTFRDEAKIGRDDLRSAVSAQTETLESRFAGVETRLGEFGKAQTEQLAAMRTEASNGRTKLEEAVHRNAVGFASSQSERLKETNDAVHNLSDRLIAAQREGREEQRASLEGVTT
jgi:DNA recombination protein RmuC